MFEKRFGFGGVGREKGTRHSGFGRFGEPCIIARGVVRHIHLCACAAPISATQRVLEPLEGFAFDEFSSRLKGQIEEGDLHGLRELVRREKCVGDPPPT